MEKNLTHWLNKYKPDERFKYKKYFWEAYDFWQYTILNIFYDERDYFNYDAYVKLINTKHSVIGTHMSKSIVHPVVWLEYKGCEIVFRYNFYDYEIAVISPKDIYFYDSEKILDKIIYSDRYDNFYYQGFPQKYRLKDTYDKNKREFMVRVFKHYDFYVFMNLVKNAIDRNDQPVRKKHYGINVWENPKTDKLRKEFCLCLKCLNFKPGHPDHCEIAKEGYQVCKRHNIAYMVTRCPKFEGKERYEKLREKAKKNKTNNTNT